MSMPWKKWLTQYLIMAIALFALFAGMQYLKGKTLEYAVEFGILWALITSTIYLAVRAYYFRKNIACQVCSDSEEENQNS